MLLCARTVATQAAPLLGIPGPEKPKKIRQSSRSSSWNSCWSTFHTQYVAWLIQSLHKASFVNMCRLQHASLQETASPAGLVLSHTCTLSDGISLLKAWWQQNKDIQRCTSPNGALLQASPSVHSPGTHCPSRCQPPGNLDPGLSGVATPLILSCTSPNEKITRLGAAQGLSALMRGQQQQ